MQHITLPLCLELFFFFNFLCVSLPKKLNERWAAEGIRGRRVWGHTAWPQSTLKGTFSKKEKKKLKQSRWRPLTSTSEWSGRGLWLCKNQTPLLWPEIGDLGIRHAHAHTHTYTHKHTRTHINKCCLFSSRSHSPTLPPPSSWTSYKRTCGAITSAGGWIVGREIVSNI